MRIVASAVLPGLVQPNSLVQEGGEVFRGATLKTARHAPAAAVDHVLWSSQGRDLQRLHQLIQDTPDIREVRVVKAQGALTTQTLPLDGRTLAPKLISEALVTAAGHPA
jgi:hypothetical protein